MHEVAKYNQMFWETSFIELEAREGSNHTSF